MVDGIDEPEFKRCIDERFESLGQNCEFGLLQRRCGAEPLGLLRFSSVRLERLIHGIRANFEGIDAPNDVRLHCEKGRDEFASDQARCQMDYCTFRKPRQLDVETFCV